MSAICTHRCHFLEKCIITTLIPQTILFYQKNDGHDHDDDDADAVAFTFDISQYFTKWSYVSIN
jgi:hypothetical protein